MLDINTESLKAMASIAASANTEIEQALTLLNHISSHNDWCCPERYQINDGIQNCRKKAAAVKNSSEGFLRAIMTVMDEFVERESGIARLFENVEGVIKKALEIVAIGGSIISGGISINGNSKSSGMLSSPESLWKTTKIPASEITKLAKINVPKSGDIMDSLTEPISAVNFENLNL